MSFNSDELATIDYQILFNKRDKEAILEKETELVAKTLSDSGFASWKIAEFMGRLRSEGIPLPATWDQADAESIGTYNPKTKRITNINSDQLDNLEVQFQSLDQSERKGTNYPKQQVAALNRIAAAIPCRPTRGGGGGGGGSGAKTSSSPPPDHSGGRGTDPGWNV